MRNEFRRPLLALAVVWCVSAAAVSWWVDSPWLLVFATGGVAGAALLLAWVMWPRKGDLVRLVLDRPRRLVYWAHHGGEPEELPFGAIRALALEETLHPRYALLWAVDTSGRWINMGQGTRTEMENFAREMAEVIRVPLWYRAPAAVAPTLRTSQKDAPSIGS